MDSFALKKLQGKVQEVVRRLLLRPAEVCRLHQMLQRTLAPFVLVHSEELPKDIAEEVIELIRFEQSKVITKKG